MDIHKTGNTMKVAVTNIKEFKDLIESAKEQADRLQKTIDQLSYFDIQFDFDVSNSGEGQLNV